MTSRRPRGAARRRAAAGRCRGRPRTSGHAGRRDRVVGPRLDDLVVELDPAGAGEHEYTSSAAPCSSPNAWRMPALTKCRLTPVSWVSRSAVAKRAPRVAQPVLRWPASSTSASFWRCTAWSCGLLRHCHARATVAGFHPGGAHAARSRRSAIACSVGGGLAVQHTAFVAPLDLAPHVGLAAALLLGGPAIDLLGLRDRIGGRTMTPVARDGCG